jgi:hypothetical protein
MTKAKSKPPLKRSTHWYSWVEYQAVHPHLTPAFKEWGDDGWSAAARLSVTRFADGAVLLEIPMRKGPPDARSNITRRFHFAPEEVAAAL